MRLGVRIMFFISGWVLLALVAVTLNILNTDWEQTAVWQGVLLILVLGVVQGSVMELVVQTITTLLVRGKVQPERRAVCDNLRLLLNYNLLALDTAEIDETFSKMYQAYMGNLHSNVTAVLVSATGGDTLKNYELHVRDNYRALVFDTLMREGEVFAEGNHRDIDPFRLVHVWQNFSHLDMRVFVRERLPEICESYSRDFMCIHRVSRVLKKCGQYQDLMLLSEGDRQAFSYTDPDYYASKARPPGEDLFHASHDVDNICGRRFHYTLVLDGDTVVPPGEALHLLAIAAANPEVSIIQPSITMAVDNNDTIYMHLDRMRQDINAPITKAIAYVLGQSGYYGKALLKNVEYIEKVIGSRDAPIERVPIDVLSHDTFEAAVLKPLYAPSVELFEAPCFNYVTWNIREMRWNKGEMILSFYFWPRVVGKLSRRLQKYFQGDDFVETKLRTTSKLDFVSSYIAHSALRQMIMKPLLLVFILLHINVHMHYPYLPIAIMMFLIIVFPKFATITRKNWKYVLVESVASVLQFTPEAVVGCVRIARAYHANICRCCGWTPQRAVEEEFRRKNPMLSSLKHLWGYSLAALLVSIPVAFFSQHYLLYVMLITLFILPLYTGITSYTTKLRQVPLNSLLTYRDNLNRSQTSISSISSTSLERLTAYTHPVSTVV